MEKTNFLLLPLLTLPICNCSNSGYVDIVSKITTDDVKDPTLVDDLGQNNSHNEEFFSEIEENDDVNNIFLSIRKMKNNNNLTFKYIQDCINLESNKVRFFKIFDSNIYQGYIGIDYNLNVDLLYFGEYSPNINSENKYILGPSSFGNYENFKIAQSNLEKENKDEAEIKAKQKNNFIKRSVSNLNPSFPCNRYDLYNFESSSYHQKAIIRNTPEYFNYSYGPVNNGCAPTSGAMLISYYDRYSSLTNLVDGWLPLKHADDRQKVNELIETIALPKYMDTDRKTGTKVDKAYNGLTNYIHDRGYPNYYARTFL